jgi:hypothetical protein
MDLKGKNLPLVWLTVLLLAFVMLIGLSNPSQAGPPKEPAYQNILTSTPDESGIIYHQVQAGQVAWTIADTYDISLFDLITQNDLGEEAIIIPGDLLYIRLAPTPTVTPDPASSQEEQGDSLESVPPTSNSGEDTKHLGPTPENLTPTDVPHATPALIGGSTAPRSSLVPIFLVLGGGLLVLVFLTVLANIGKIRW